MILSGFKRPKTMKNVNKIFYIILITTCWSCVQSSKTEKYQNKRDNMVNVQDKVKEIEMEDILIGSIARLYSIGNYLIIADHKTMDKLIHIFNKNNFSHITSLGYMGQGPDEITIMGHIGIDEINHRFYVSDHGKQKIFSYNIDSVLVDPSFKPEVIMTMNKEQFPSTYQIINDTLAIGLIIEPTSNYEFDQSLAKWNIETGKIEPMKYTHPDIEGKRITFAASKENGIYVECYSYYDLMTICDIAGNLRCNVYGNNWDKRKTKEIHHYGNVVFCGNKILASYSGGNNLTNEYYPTQFFVFNTNGDYIKTLDIGYRISHFCYDEQNDRLIFAFDDMIQFGYLALNDLLD
jgi:hypothetical protein